tara:strand:+ start:5541 stop:6143 length:603 start_codon:yes stop_codon:yes gene_type:complete
MNYKKIIYSSYYYLNRNIPLLFGDRICLGHHNSTLLKIARPSKNTFEGKLYCGASCYLLSYYLKQHGITTRVFKSQVGRGRNKEDHVFLKLDSYIIDPTYRQMFSTNYKINDNYINYLYNNLPFVFIGKDINNIYNELDKVHYKTYKQKLCNENLVFWRNPVELHDFCDLELVLNDKEYAEKKGQIFYDIHKKYHYSFIL